MVGPAVVQALGDTFEQTENSGLRLEERLLMCLEAAQATGGDNRGRQSTAVQVHWKRIDANPYLDIRIDDHPNPIPGAEGSDQDLPAGLPGVLLSNLA